MMFINGNNYVVNNKRNFSPHKIADEELDRVADFAYEMCFGDGHHRAYRTGGDLIRHAGEKFCNTFQGKIAEVCLRKFFRDKGLDSGMLNFDVYGEGIWDDTDLVVNGKSLSIKSAAYFSNLLLLECHDYDDEGRYKPNIGSGATDSYDYYVLMRISPDIKSLFKNQWLLYSDNISREKIHEIIHSHEWNYDIAGWILHDEFVEVIRRGDVIPKNSILNGSVKMDADNYYVQAGEMHTPDELIARLS